MSDFTPYQVEQKLAACIEALEAIPAEVDEARVLEVGAKLDYEAAVNDAFVSPDCPKVERGGATVAERDAWIARQAKEQYSAYLYAQADLARVKDKMATIRDQGPLIASLGKSVLMGYEYAGRVNR